MPYWRQLLSMRLDSQETAAVGAVTGEDFRNRLFAVLERLLLALAKQKPVVVVLEDLHWADHSSLELLDHLVRLITQAPIAFVLLSRPKQESSGNWEKTWARTGGLSTVSSGNPAQAIIRRGERRSGARTSRWQHASQKTIGGHSEQIGG